MLRFICKEHLTDLDVIFVRHICGILRKGDCMAGNPMRPTRPSILVTLLALMILVPGCSEDPVEAPPPKPPQITTNGLIAFYPFNGDALDASGNNAHGTLLPGASVTNVLTIAYNGDNDNFVSLPYLIFHGVNDFTISTWARIDTVKASGSHCIISGAQSNTYNNELLLYYLPNTSSWGLLINQVAVVFGPSATMSDKSWHHVVVVRNGSIGRVYLDDQQIGDGMTVETAAMNIAAGGLVLGQDQDAVGAAFDKSQAWAGDLDNLRIYNRALNSSEIHALYLETGWGE